MFDAGGNGLSGRHESRMKHRYDAEDERKNAIDAIRRIAALLGKTPTQQDYKTHRKRDELSLEQIMYRFSRYGVAVEAAGFLPNAFQNPPRQPEITKDELVHEYINVANKLGKLPSNHEFRVNSRYSWTPYKTKWGSFRSAAEDIAANYGDKFTFQVVIKEHRAKRDKRKLLSYSCALAYEPSNEYEPIVSFSLLAEMLGYKISRVQADFPDATLIDNHGVEVYIEFEYLCSNYKQHCHPMDFKGLVICLRKDIDLDGIRVISLEDYVRQKRG
jgi:hypothetical protein